MKSDVFEAIYKQRQDGANYQDIAQEMVIHPTTTYNVFNAISKVGYETAKQILVDRSFLTHIYC